MQTQTEVCLLDHAHVWQDNFQARKTCDNYHGHTQTCKDHVLISAMAGQYFIALQCMIMVLVKIVTPSF